MSIRGEDVSVIDEMFDSRKTLHIPVYQRNYDWKEYHCEKLISDIEKAVDRETKEYFIGSFVLVRKEDDKKSFYIIDGQQRITTKTSDSSLEILLSTGILNIRPKELL